MASSQRGLLVSNAAAGVSKTLEYAHDDHALALLAKELGDTGGHQDLMRRSKNYRNRFDRETRLMRGRSHPNVTDLGGVFDK